MIILGFNKITSYVLVEEPINLRAFPILLRHFLAVCILLKYSIKNVEIQPILKTGILIGGLKKSVLVWTGFPLGAPHLP